MAGTARYTGVVSLTLRGNLNHRALVFALNEMLRRHEVLRTVYRTDTEGEPIAVVRTPRPLELKSQDLTDSGVEETGRALVAEANRLVRTPFDLANDTMIRALLFKVDSDEHVLMISSHYIAVDGWTVGLMVREISEHYAASVESRPPQIPEAAVQCIDYAHWQRSQINARTIESNMAYWRQKMDGLPPQELAPLDNPRQPVNNMRGSTRHFSLTPADTRALKDFSHRHGSTLFFTLASALNVLLYACSGKRDIVVGTITGDRESGMETIFGSFVNCLPLRNQLDPEQSFLSIMENVRRCTIDAYAHQIPFGKIAEAAALDRDLGRDPLFRVTLVVRNIPFTEMAAGGLEIRLLQLPVDRAVSEGDLSIYLQEFGGSLSGYFEYNRDIFEASTIEHLAKNFIHLLSVLTTNPKTQINDVLESSDWVDQKSCMIA
jgi:hypothetical protein